VWIDYPAAELLQRQLETPGIGYPSGGAVQKLVGLWRALAPSIDMIGPDIYADNLQFYRQVMAAYLGRTTRSGFQRPGATTASGSCSSAHLGKARSDSRRSEWIRQDGISSAIHRGRS